MIELHFNSSLSQRYERKIAKKIKSCYRHTSFCEAGDVVKKWRDALSSFLAGFGERSDPDVINGMFIAEKKLCAKSSFTFESRGCLGVESKEIRIILNFDEPLKKGINHKEFFKAGRTLSKMNSNELGWTAQFLMDGNAHLYPHETRKAKKIEKSLKLLCP